MLITIAQGHDIMLGKMTSVDHVTSTDQYLSISNNNTVNSMIITVTMTTLVMKFS